MAGESVGLDLASQSGQLEIVDALSDLKDAQVDIKGSIDAFALILRNKEMGGGGGGGSGSDDTMNLMDLHYLGYDSYTYKTSTLMERYYADDDLVNTFEIAGYLLEYGIQQEYEIGAFFKRIEDIDLTVDWDSIADTSDLAADSDAVDAILENSVAKNAVAMSPTALTAIASLDEDNAIIADRVLYLCGLRPGFYDSYSDFIDKDSNKILLANSSQALTFLTTNATRIAILFSDATTVLYALKSEQTRPILLTSQLVLNAMASTESLMTLITGSQDLMKELVKSQSVMAALSENTTFVNAIFGNLSIITELIGAFSTVGAAIVNSTNGFTALMSSVVAKSALADNDTAVMYILEKICGLNVGDSEYSTLASVMTVLCQSPDGLISLESFSQSWNDLSKRIFQLINASTDYVTAIYSILTTVTDRFTAGSRIDQDTVANANSSCSGKGKFYACKLSGWSSNSGKSTTLYIGGSSMGTGCREVDPSNYGMSSSTVNAIGIGPSTFTESGDGRLSVVPYTIVTS